MGTVQGRGKQIGTHGTQYDSDEAFEFLLTIGSARWYGWFGVFVIVVVLGMSNFMSVYAVQDQLPSLYIPK